MISFDTDAKRGKIDNIKIAKALPFSLGCLDLSWRKRPYHTYTPSQPMPWQTDPPRRAVLEITTSLTTFLGPAMKMQS
jgi:hypothetical protein